MQVYEATHDFGKFLRWFGNARDSVKIDLEKMQDAAVLGEEDFPFTEEDLKIWQQAGLIKISEVVLDPNDFKPYQSIIVRCKTLKTPIPI